MVTISDGLIPVTATGGWAYLFVDVRDRRGELQAVQQVVPVVIVHLEVMQLQLLRRHLLLRFIYHPVQMLHDVAERQNTHTHTMT